MKGRISELLRKILSDTKARKALNDAILGGKPSFMAFGKKYKIRQYRQDGKAGSS